ncbi:hypothetical protein CFO_g2729 [Ceratocystis platani]|uniref:Uncharacterized protein n=1 Tax=Ceratocystis fimbriata f. sp. platani TaxID=88771 RepID=A0A0F8B1A8_CERFI|nr:hypothetical protein CFO_g2729 [Ceratocystis platani]
MRPLRYATPRKLRILINSETFGKDSQTSARAMKNYQQILMLMKKAAEHTKYTGKNSLEQKEYCWSLHTCEDYEGGYAADDEYEESIHGEVVSLSDNVMIDPGPRRRVTVVEAPIITVVTQRAVIDSVDSANSGDSSDSVNSLDATTTTTVSSTQKSNLTTRARAIVHRVKDSMQDFGHRLKENSKRSSIPMGPAHPDPLDEIDDVGDLIANTAINPSGREASRLLLFNHL